MFEWRGCESDCPELVTGELSSVLQSQCPASTSSSEPAEPGVACGGGRAVYTSTTTTLDETHS